MGQWPVVLCPLVLELDGARSKGSFSKSPSRPVSDANRNHSRVMDVRGTGKGRCWRTSYENCFSSFAGR